MSADTVPARVDAARARTAATNLRLRREAGGRADESAGFFMLRPSVAGFSRVSPTNAPRRPAIPDFGGAFRPSVVRPGASVVAGEVGVAAQGLFVMLHQGAHLYVGQAPRAGGALGLAAHGFDHIFGHVLHVAEHVRHAVALDHVADLVALVAQ